MSAKWRSVSTKALFTELDAWRLAAKQRQVSLAGWIRDTLNKASIVGYAAVVLGTELDDSDRMVLRFAARAHELERELEHTRRELARLTHELAQLRSSG